MNCFSSGDQRDVVLSDSHYSENKRDIGTRGWRLVVHEKDTAPLLERKVDIMPGTSTSIGVSSLKMSRLQEPYTPCIQDQLIPNTQYLVTKDSCKKYCVMVEVERKCGCVPVDLVLNRLNLTTQYCSWYNASDPLQMFQTSACEQHTRKGFVKTVPVNCPLKCEWRCQETKYYLKTSFLTFPPREAMAWVFQNYLYNNPQREKLMAWKYFIQHVKEAEKTPEEYLSNYTDKTFGTSVIPDVMAKWMSSSFARVNIYYDSLDVGRVKQGPSYNLGQLWADIGGILSLWTGLSVLGILKFILKVEISKFCQKGEEHPARTV